MAVAGVQPDPGGRSNASPTRAAAPPLRDLGASSASGAGGNPAARLAFNRRQDRRARAQAPASAPATKRKRQSSPSLPSGAAGQLDYGEQLRLWLDRFFAGNIALIKTAPIALLLLMVRGFATLKSAQSLPTRIIAFTETNPLKMLPSAKKMRPFTFTKRAGIVGAFASSFILLLLFLIAISPVLLLGQLAASLFGGNAPSF